MGEFDDEDQSYEDALELNRKLKAMLEKAGVMEPPPPSHAQHRSRSQPWRAGEGNSSRYSRESSHGFQSDGLLREPSISRTVDYVSRPPRRGAKSVYSQRALAPRSAL